jgi:hypothetical protein
MNYLANFKDFYLRTVLPNAPSYNSYFSSSNFDTQIGVLIDKYRENFGNDPFEISDLQQDVTLLKSNLSQPDTGFSEYSDAVGSGVPKAILTTHFVKFLEFEGKTISFANLQTLIDRINAEVNTVGKNYDFIGKFREFRKNAVGQTRVIKANLLFGDVRDNSWTINLGAEKELQYHLHLNEDVSSIRYGLGFNMQASGNNREPIENARPFKEAFFAQRFEIDKTLQDYRFWYDDEKNLRNLVYGSFSLYAQEIPFEETTDEYIVQGLDYLKMLYDLKHKQFKAYQIIFNNSEKPSSELLKITAMSQHKNLLLYKKQFILQGPPGTGKTREAKDLAELMIFNEVSPDKITQSAKLKNINQFKLIQFHPSFSYEDFVRGIVAKPTESGEGIFYEAEDKLLGNFAKEALKNYLASKGESTVDLSFQGKLNALLEQIRTTLDKGKTFIFDEKSTAHVIAIKDDGILYSFPQREEIKYKLLFSDMEKIYNFKDSIEKPIDLRDAELQLGLGMKGKYPYYYMTLQRLEEIKVEAIQVQKEELKNFVLIIDEINRANLSSVLGELIYALEYRGESVESMYAVSGDNELILPPNLYIIGTMNTADRSVGHIDYAIRRRFAFVDVLPENLAKYGLAEFDEPLFRKISELFIANYDGYYNSDESPKRATTLSIEFRVEDVWLGHSYFINKEDGGDIRTRLDYEIKPILMEYVKDGILIGKVGDIAIENYIKSL